METILQRKNCQHQWQWKIKNRLRFCPKCGLHQKGFILKAKSDSMMSERIALKMIDEQGWILRQKIIWAKQILLINKEKRTIGSVMPTSVKDRFNMSWEYLYHFVKNKKYYFDLDSVRIPPQTFENRPYGIIREREFGYDTEYPEIRNPMVFNYRVRDAERKAGQPQFKASEEEIKKWQELKEKCYGNDDKGARRSRIRAFMDTKNKRNWKIETLETERKYKTNPDPRGNDKGGSGSYRLWKDKHPYLKPLEMRLEDTKNKDTKSSRAYNLKKLLSEIRLGLKPNTGIMPYQGKFLNHPEAEMFGSPRARNTRKVKENQEYKTRNPERSISLLGKNIPTVFQINHEPHNFKKELGALGYKVKDNLTKEQQNYLIKELDRLKII